MEGSIKNDLKEIRYDGVAWIQLAHTNIQWLFFLVAVKNISFTKMFPLHEASFHGSLLSLLFILN
jgi:hypothetical protein